MRPRKAYKYFFSKGIITREYFRRGAYKSALAEYATAQSYRSTMVPIPLSPRHCLNRQKAEVEQLKRNKDTKVIINIARVSKQKPAVTFACMKQPEKEGENIIAIILGGHVRKTRNYTTVCWSSSPAMFSSWAARKMQDYLLCSDAFVLFPSLKACPSVCWRPCRWGSARLHTRWRTYQYCNGHIGYLSADTGCKSLSCFTQAWLRDAPNPAFAELAANGIKNLQRSVQSMEGCASKYNQLYFDALTSSTNAWCLYAGIWHKGIVAIINNTMTNFIIFTTQRSGSTVITRTLDAHPQIFVPVSCCKHPTISITRMAFSFPRLWFNKSRSATFE